jgi:hypothetical protein
MYGKCNFCSRETAVYPLQSWDNPEMIEYYCYDHYLEVNLFQEKQKRAFIEHFKDPVLRKKWLSENQQKLYNRLF